MKIQIELIGYLRTRGLPNGSQGGELEIAEGTTVADLLIRLEIEKGVPLLPAVNGSVPENTDILHEGDLVQFAPPIAGG